MDVRGRVDIEATYPVVRKPEPNPPKSSRKWNLTISGSRTLVVLLLISADVLLALLLWQVALP
jgi:hypothetical protein